MMSDTSIKETYFLHVLLTDPAKVIPPGKSLLSMLTRKEDRKPNSQIYGQVKQAAHRAFWDEATETISSELPATQIPRLNRLYLDLHQALLPLFPPEHPILLSLSAPLPPTSSPLHSTIQLLKDVLHELKKRCAPFRDPDIDGLLLTLASPPTSTADLAQLVVSTVRSTTELADLLKSDVNAFVLGNMTDSQLKAALFDYVKTRERDTVLSLWHGSDAIRTEWRSWVLELPFEHPVPSDRRWIARLFIALDSNKPVACNIPIDDDVSNKPEEPRPSNYVPPQLFFIEPALVHVQNYIQAIVIAAALRFLTHLPPTNSHEFMTRIWALLKTEVDEDDPTQFQSRAALSPETHTPTKLINLADEVVRARQLNSTARPFSSDDEQNLRGTVDRTLRATDPVYLLLKRRLLAALEKSFVEDQAPHPTYNFPSSMQTGRQLDEGRVPKRTRLHMDGSTKPPQSPPPPPLNIRPLGFEDPLLQTAINEVRSKLADSIAWTEAVWGDLV